jgi:hypothetical protein
MLDEEGQDEGDEGDTSSSQQTTTSQQNQSQSREARRLKLIQDQRLTLELQ